MIEIIPDILFYTSSNDVVSLRKSMEGDARQRIFFTVDDTLLYTSFFADFGPLDINSTHKFFHMLEEHLNVARASGLQVVFYSSSHPHRRTNAVTLICAYMVCIQKRTPCETYAAIRALSPALTPYRDAAFSTNTFPLTIIDCIKGMHRAMCLGCYSYSSFSSVKYEMMAKLENGDCSWIIPGKFIAFSGPLSSRRDLGSGRTTLLPHEYIPVLKNLGVTCIIRFNSKCYDRKVFITAGIRHEDLFYEDGGNPSDSILQSFLRICESERGVIAVHCKAGLGRTGTNIAAYMMKHLGFTARECIAWCRLCRPGSIVGPQQHYLVSIEDAMKQQGAKYRQSREHADMRRLDASVTSLAASFASLTTLSTQASSTSSLPRIVDQGTASLSSGKAVAIIESNLTLTKRKDLAVRSKSKQGLGGTVASMKEADNANAKPAALVKRDYELHRPKTRPLTSLATTRTVWKRSSSSAYAYESNNGKEQVRSSRLQTMLHIAANRRPKTSDNKDYTF